MHVVFACFGISGLFAAIPIVSISNQWASSLLMLVESAASLQSHPYARRPASRSTRHTQSAVERRRRATRAHADTGIAA